VEKILLIYAVCPADGKGKKKEGEEGGSCIIEKCTTIVTLPREGRYAVSPSFPRKEKKKKRREMKGRPRLPSGGELYLDLKS